MSKGPDHPERDVRPRDPWEAFMPASLDDSLLDCYERAIYLHVLRRGTCTEGVEGIARRLLMDVKTARRACAVLVRCGWLERGNGYKTTAKFTVLKGGPCRDPEGRSLAPPRPPRPPRKQGDEPLTPEQGESEPSGAPPEKRRSLDRPDSTGLDRPDSTGLVTGEGTKDDAGEDSDRPFSTGLDHPHSTGLDRPYSTGKGTPWEGPPQKEIETAGAKRPTSGGDAHAHDPQPGSPEPRETGSGTAPPRGASRQQGFDDPGEGVAFDPVALWERAAGEAMPSGLAEHVHVVVRVGDSFDAWRQAVRDTTPGEDPEACLRRFSHLARRASRPTSGLLNSTPFPAP